VGCTQLSLCECDVVGIRNIASGGTSGADTLKWMRDAFYKKARITPSPSPPRHLHPPLPPHSTAPCFHPAILCSRVVTLTFSSQVESKFNEIEKQRAPKTITRTVRFALLQTLLLLRVVLPDSLGIHSCAQMSVSTPRSKLAEGQSAFD
jgi:hypothetical protein